MFFKHKGVVPVGYTASKFLLTSFIVGLVILSLAFVYYTKQILQLNQDLEEQVGPLADLAAEVPGVNEFRLQDQLNRIVMQLLNASRLSFIITDASDDRIIIAKRIDETIDRKINADPPIPLSPVEQSKLQAVLERMKEKNKEPKEIPYLLENRTVYGYFYHGEADTTAIDRIPFVFTDLNDKPQKWQIWERLLTAKEATPEQYAQAEMLVRNSKAQGLYVPLQTTPELRQGNFYYEKTRYYGIIVMPIVLVVVFSTFLAVGFLSYRRIKSSEQAAIWGGLAKETAHQLGTPISALMGWLELLVERNQQKGDQTTIEIYVNMQSDLVRLQKITARFGKIGSYPQKTEIELNEVIGEVVIYFQKRLPNRSKQVEIRVTPHELPYIFANADLLQWVFENLIRNSLDAMDKAAGLIEIAPRFDEKRHQIIILYRDNGKGIKRRGRHKIFHPGVTTKKHGWGLGLTLVKRIVEEYHHGQIRLIETGPAGTTFEIVLPVAVRVMKASNVMRNT